MAIADCIQNSITLEVYTDYQGKAYGYLYLDDGETTSKNILNSVLISFTYTDNALFSKFDLNHSYKFPIT